jgi:hypothetical protein
MTSAETVLPYDHVQQNIKQSIVMHPANTHEHCVLDQAQALSVLMSLACDKSEP